MRLGCTDLPAITYPDDPGFQSDLWHLGFDPEILKDVVERKDELAKLAINFTRMAQEVKDREQQQKRRDPSLPIEINAAKTERQG